MAKLTKKQKALAGQGGQHQAVLLLMPLALVKDAATAKFDESIDVAVQLGWTPRSPTRWCAAPWCCQRYRQDHPRRQRLRRAPG